MLDRFVRPPTVRTQSGDDYRLGADVVFAVGFLEVEHIQAGEIQDIDRYKR